MTLSVISISTSEQVEASNKSMQRMELRASNDAERYACKEWTG